MNRFLSRAYLHISMLLLFALTVTAMPMPLEVNAASKRTKSDLIDRMSEINYVEDSITKKSSRSSNATINKSIKSGTRTTAGPTFTKYKEIMNYEWTDCTEYKKKAEEVTVDLTKRMKYADYEKTLKKLSRYDGVYLYKIGESVEGKNLYSIEVDIGGNSSSKSVIALTGLVHSREQAGGMFLLKSLATLIQKAQTDKTVKSMLAKYKYVAVPWVSLDVSEDMKWDSNAYLKNGEYWKSAADGIDINRDFPSMTAGWKRYDVAASAMAKKYAGSDNFAGSYMGENPETQALMKWFYHYIVVEKAVAYLDFHQQGRLIYHGQPICSSEQNKLNATFANKLASHIGYRTVGPSSVKSDYDSQGGNTTEYAMSLAIGKYSPKYGSYVFWDGKKEILPMAVLNADGAKNAGYKLKTTNSKLLAITVEIGSGSSYLGGSKNAYMKNAAEYTNYHFDTLLTKLPKMIEETLK